MHFVAWKFYVIIFFLYAYCEGVKFNKIYLYIYDSLDLPTILNEHKFKWQLNILQRIYDCFASGDTCYIKSLHSWQDLNIEYIKEGTQKI